MGRASQTVNDTANATIHPVHLLLLFLVTLGKAKCTNKASARLMPRGYDGMTGSFSPRKPQKKGDSSLWMADAIKLTITILIHL